MIIRQSTTVTVSVGPILDSTGAEYTGAVIGDLTITKNGTSAAMAATATLTHTSNGHYDLAMTTGNTDTVGQTTIRCNKATYQMPRMEFNVVEEVVYDALFAASATLPGDIAAIDDALFLAMGATFDTATDSLEAIRNNTGTAGAGLTAADDAVITAIAALNNLSVAQVNAECDTAISDAALVSKLDAIQADLPQRITKNTALSAFMFKMVDSTDHITAETGLTITATRSLDGAAFASCANSATEVSGGWYKIDLAAGDLNGNVVVLKFTGTGADTREIVLITQPT